MLYIDSDPILCSTASSSFTALTVILFLPLHQFHACILSAFGVAAQGCSIHRSFSCKGARGEVWDKICSLPFESTHSWIRRLCREHNSLLLRLEQEDWGLHWSSEGVCCCNFKNFCYLTQPCPHFHVWLPSPPHCPCLARLSSSFLKNKSVCASLSHHSSSLYSFQLCMHKLLPLLIPRV